ncbi:MAG: hypothetical protein ACXVPD_14810, partial [Bacteroidia bacterium]
MKNSEVDAEQEALVPFQHKGAYTGVTQKIKLGSAIEAFNAFADAKKRLLDINNWHNISGGGAEFQHTDHSGRELYNSFPETGDLIRIRLPAPQRPSGGGYDWVRIEKFESAKDVTRDEEFFGFRVRPVSDPNKKEAASAHFYTSASTSTFMVSRHGTSVSAMERGRNEVPNVKEPSLLSRIRNFMVAAM